VLDGALMGVTAALMYALLVLFGRYVAPDSPPIPFIYYIAHVLKVAGGWFALRRAIA
jgi:hypothetical protein